jgi:type IV pilus assembly protein PilM
VEISHLLANDSVVGIDIGSSQMKIVYAEAAKGSSRISRIAICPTPPESVKEGVVVNIPEVAAALKNCLRNAGIKSQNAIAAVAGPGVIVRQVQVPTMPERVLRKTIGFEATKYISTTVEDSVVEFDILGPSETDGQMNIMLAAAPRQMVDTRVAVLEMAGLDPIALDVEVLASIRSLTEYSSNKSLVDRTIAILEIGGGHSEINLISQGNLEITRTIPISGDSLTNSIRTALGCEFAEAEARKLDLDISILCDTPAGSTEDPALRGVQNLIDELLREVRRSVNYYQSQSPEGTVDNNVDTVILSGGSARMRGLGEYVTSRLGLGVIIGNPELLGYIKQGQDAVIKAEDTPLLSVAFGLATKEMRAERRDAVTAA